MKKRGAYKKAGMNSFSNYITLAEEVGIVELGGMDEKAWVSLMPQYYDALPGPLA